MCYRKTVAFAWKNPCPCNRIPVDGRTSPVPASPYPHPRVDTGIPEECMYDGGVARLSRPEERGVAVLRPEGEISSGGFDRLSGSHADE